MNASEEATGVKKGGSSNNHNEQLVNSNTHACLVSQPGV